MPSPASPLRRLAVAVAVVLGALLLAGPGVALGTTSIKPKRELVPRSVEVARPFGSVKQGATARASTLHFHGGFPGATATSPINPPDVGGAVSSGQFVQTDAQSVTVLTRDGVEKARVPLNDWCGGFTSSARVLYDRRLQRWFMTFLTSGEDQVLCIWASRGYSATGEWNVYGFPLPTPTDGFGAGQRLGMDGDAIFVAYDQYDEFGDYARSAVLPISKSDLLSADNFSIPFYDAVPPLVPPVMTDNAHPSSFFIYAPTSGTKLKLYAGTALHRGGPLTPMDDVTVPAYTAPPAAGLPDSGARLETESAFTGPSYQVGSQLVNAHTINRNGHPTNRWYMIDVNSSTLLRSGRLFESSTSDDFSPSIAASKGDGCQCEPIGSVFFTWTSTDERNATVSKRHNPRMRAAAWVTEDTTTNRSGSAVITGDEYAPAPEELNGWGRSQVTLNPRGFGSCPASTQAFAIGPRAVDKEHFGAYIKRIGTC